MRGVQRWLPRVLVVAGVSALAWGMLQYLDAARYQRQMAAELAMAEAPLLDLDEVAPIFPAALNVGDAIGTFEVPRLGLSGVVVEGDEDDVLDRAIGHLPDTPLPWHDGNSALAAHRDGLFRPLKDVRPGDVLRLETRHGTLEYRVKDTLIVQPEDVWVLDPTPSSMLTLISCYPFNFIGNAPQRFIVRAERVAMSPSIGS